MLGSACVQLLCRNEKHETRYHHCLRRDDDRPAQCVLSDDVAVRAEEPGIFDDMKAGLPHRQKCSSPLFLP